MGTSTSLSTGTHWWKEWNSNVTTGMCETQPQDENWGAEWSESWRRFLQWFAGPFSEPPQLVCVSSFRVAGALSVVAENAAVPRVTAGPQVNARACGVLAEGRLRQFQPRPGEALCISTCPFVCQLCCERNKAWLSSSRKEARRWSGDTLAAATGSRARLSVPLSIAGHVSCDRH